MGGNSKEADEETEKGNGFVLGFRLFPDACEEPIGTQA